MGNKITDGNKPGQATSRVTWRAEAKVLGPKIIKGVARATREDAERDKARFLRCSNVIDAEVVVII